MTRSSQRLGLLMLCAAFLSPAARGEEKPRPPKPDLSESATAGSVWQGMSRVAAAGARKSGSLFETLIKVTGRDVESIEFDYWITLGNNAGGSDRRGLHLTGTVNRDGRITATPEKILAGSWQNPNLLDERWTGQLIADKKAPRIVLHRQMDRGMVEIGVIKKN